MSVTKRSHSIGDFRHRIVLLYRKNIENIENIDGYIEEVDQEIASVWAKIEPISGF